VADTGNALDVMALVTQFKPQIIFMDICMPHMTGVDLSEMLLEEYPQCQVIILTGHQNFEDAKRCVNAGVSAFISKPINGSEIEETLQKIALKVTHIQSLLGEAVETVSGNLLFSPLKSCSTFIEDVKVYVLNHYADSELSLTRVADLFYTHPNHLSRRFSHEQGLTFKEYLLRVRLEAAVQLIQASDYKNYEIAEKIGMVDPNYFCVYFKKMLHMTVGEYRKLHLNK